MIAVRPGYTYIPQGSREAAIRAGYRPCKICRP
ncbi:MAG: hypothetical protein JXA60_11750 [Candidatus Coatesbacteria bacterium]|nr:hypothetical protein [Candidatus Coatesbacteria bacterium]